MAHTFHMGAWLPGQCGVIEVMLQSCMCACVEKGPGVSHCSAMMVAIATRTAFNNSSASVVGSWVCVAWRVGNVGAPATSDDRMRTALAKFQVLLASWVEIGSGVVWRFGVPTVATVRCVALWLAVVLLKA